MTFHEIVAKVMQEINSLQEISIHLGFSYEEPYEEARFYAFSPYEDQLIVRFQLNNVGEVVARLANNSFRVVSNEVSVIKEVLLDQLRQYLEFQSNRYARLLQENAPVFKDK